MEYNKFYIIEDEKAARISLFAIIENPVSLDEFKTAIETIYAGDQ